MPRLLREDPPRGRHLELQAMLPHLPPLLHREMGASLETGQRLALPRLPERLLRRPERLPLLLRQTPEPGDRARHFTAQLRRGLQTQGPHLRAFMHPPMPPGPMPGMRTDRPQAVRLRRHEAARQVRLGRFRHVPRRVQEAPEVPQPFLHQALSRRRVRGVRRRCRATVLLRQAGSHRELRGGCGSGGEVRLRGFVREAAGVWQPYVRAALPRGGVRKLRARGGRCQDVSLRTDGLERGQDVVP